MEKDKLLDSQLESKEKEELEQKLKEAKAKIESLEHLQELEHNRLNEAKINEYNLTKSKITNQIYTLLLDNPELLTDERAKKLKKLTKSIFYYTEEQIKEVSNYIDLFVNEVLVNIVIHNANLEDKKIVFTSDIIEAYNECKNKNSFGDLNCEYVIFILWKNLIKLYENTDNIPELNWKHVDTFTNAERQPLLISPLDDSKCNLKVKINPNNSRIPYTIKVDNGSVQGINIFDLFDNYDSVAFITSRKDEVRRDNVIKEAKEFYKKFIEPAVIAFTDRNLLAADLDLPDKFEKIYDKKLHGEKVKDYIKNFFDDYIENYRSYYKTEVNILRDNCTRLNDLYNELVQQLILNKHEKNKERILIRK